MPVDRNRDIEVLMFETLYDWSMKQALYFVCWLLSLHPLGAVVVNKDHGYGYRLPNGDL